MPKYHFANGQIIVEGGMYAPLKGRENDDEAGVVLIPTQGFVRFKKNQQDNRSKDHAKPAIE
jgi:hypothetical protein